MGIQAGGEPIGWGVYIGRERAYRKGCSYSYGPGHRDKDRTD